MFTSISQKRGSSMNPKRIIIVGTMAIAITISAGLYGNDVSANTLYIPIDKSGTLNNTKETTPASPNTETKVTSNIAQVLGLSSSEELYDALYKGSSLADIAENNHIPVQNIIDLQVAELTEQLNSRLKSGSITPGTYESQKSELPEIITKSIHVRMTP
jgi:hypothetical protein